MNNRPGLTDRQIHDLTRLIGRPYDDQNRAPGFHCWGLFCAVRAILGQEGLPEVPLPDMTLEGRARALRDHPERDRWREIRAAVTGCAVLMGRRALPTHVGAFLDLDGGGVIHALPGVGVSFDTFQKLKANNWLHQSFHLPI
jgi:hypothetical protein